MPDVNYCLRWRGSNNAVEGWVELKWANLTQGAGTLFLNQHKVLQSQQNWHAKQSHSGGRSFLLTGRGNYVYLHRAMFDDVTGMCNLDDANTWSAIDAARSAELRIPVQDARLGRELLYCLTR